MFFISLFRAIKFSFQDFVRNIWLSLVTIFVLLLALFSVNVLITINTVGNAMVDAVRDKVDISLYLKTDTPEDKIKMLKARISNIENVSDVTYISQGEALKNFQAKHKNDPEILDALKEIGKNPLTPTLVVKPKNIARYDELINNLNKINDDIIDSRDFEDHRTLIYKINQISTRINETGMIVSFVFIGIALLMVYNSIRVAIYTHRREINIMRFVGASNWFIKAPFLISALLYALMGVLAIIIIFFGFLNILQPYLEVFFVDYNVNIIAYFADNFWQIFSLEFLVVAMVNVVASIIAVGKYSKV
jgi:cell division transport system permease protein